MEEKMNNIRVQDIIDALKNANADDFPDCIGLSIDEAEQLSRTLCGLGLQIACMLHEGRPICASASGTIRIDSPFVWISRGDRPLAVHHVPCDATLIVGNGSVIKEGEILAIPAAKK
jgi:hypothetical protein